MQKMSLDEYRSLTRDAQVLERDPYGDKVLLTPGGLIVKLFRRKRRLSSALIRPYATRFRDNSKCLQERGVHTVTVENVYNCPEQQRHIVTYRRLDGIPLREVFQRFPNDNVVFEGLARFIAELHYKGIYFRSLHLGNILLQRDGNFALIDIADLRCKYLPLGPLARTRNFRHMLRYEQDVELFRRFGMKKFLKIYLFAAGISAFSARIFLKRLSATPNLFATPRK